MKQQTGLQAEAHLLQSRLAVVQGQMNEARQELVEARRICPNDLDLLRIHCQFFFEQGDWPAARRLIEELISRDPDDASAHHNLGSVLERLGEIDLAICSLNESLRLRPDSILTWRQLGHACNTKGRLEAARKAWNQVLCLEPGDAEAQSMLKTLSQKAV